MFSDLATVHYILVLDCVGIMNAAVTGFDAAVVGIHLDCGINGLVIAESIDDLLVQGPLIILHRKKVIGIFVKDMLCDTYQCADGID